MQITHYSCPIQRNRNFLTDFRKILKYQINENPSSGSRIVLCGRTDGQRHNEAKSRFSHICEQPKKGSYMEDCINLKSSKCCSTATLKNTFGSTLNYTKRIKVFYLKLQITSVVETVLLKIKERLPYRSVYTSSSCYSFCLFIFTSHNFQNCLSAFSYLSDWPYKTSRINSDIFKHKLIQSYFVIKLLFRWNKSHYFSMEGIILI